VRINEAVQMVPACSGGPEVPETRALALIGSMSPRRPTQAIGFGRNGSDDQKLAEDAVPENVGLLAGSSGRLRTPRVNPRSPGEANGRPTGENRHGRWPSDRPPEGAPFSRQAGAGVGPCLEVRQGTIRRGRAVSRHAGRPQRGRDRFCGQGDSRPRVLSHATTCGRCSQGIG